MGNLLYDFDVRIPLVKVEGAVKRAHSAVRVWRYGVAPADQVRLKDLHDVRSICMQAAGVDDAARAGSEWLEVDEAGKAIFISALRNDVTSMNGVMGFLAFALLLKCFEENLNYDESDGRWSDGGQITIPVSWKMVPAKYGRSGNSLFQVTEYKASVSMTWSPKGDGVFEKWTPE